MQVRDMYCCGTKEISGLTYEGTPEQALRQLPRVSPACYVFTGASYYATSPAPYAKRFKDYILKHRLGVVTESAPRRNPNSGRFVTLYVWSVNSKAFSAWRQNKA